jgi:cholesterol transport system auxiliary component
MSTTPRSSICRTRSGWRIRPLFGRLVGEVIAARTGRVVLDPSQFSHDPGTQLTGQLSKFGLDPTSMEVVVVYDAAISRGAEGVRTNRFEARVPVAEATPAAVAPALNQAANQVAEQVATWVGG